MIKKLTFGTLLAALACGGDTTGPDVVPGPPPPPPPPGGSFVVEFATYVGGSGVEEMREPMILADGRLLVGSRTFGGMPTTAGAFQPSYGGGTGDGWLGIFSTSGQLEAGSYLGGSGMERPPYGIDVLPGGDIVTVVGSASANIPTSGSAFRPNIHSPIPSPGEGIVCRIAPDLRSRRWCTYIGGGWPRGGLLASNDGNIIIAGRVAGANFPTTPGAAQRTARGPDDAFIMKLSSDGQNAVFSTRIGGSGTLTGESAMSLREHPDGSVSFNGHSPSADFPVSAGAAQTVHSGPRDAYIGRLSADGSTFSGVTLFGGAGQEFAEHRMALLPDGSRVSVGTTTSSDLPATGGFRGDSDSFIVKVDPTGTSFEWARYLGGSGADALLGPTVDASGRLYVYGRTTSTDLATSADAIQRTYGGGPADGVIYVLSPTGTVEYASYIGGSGDEVVRGLAIGSDGALYFVGRSDSPDFPTTPGAFQRNHAGDYDGFILKLVPDS